MPPISPLLPSVAGHYSEPSSPAVQCPVPLNAGCPPPSLRYRLACWSCQALPLAASTDRTTAKHYFGEPLQGKLPRNRLGHKTQTDSGGRYSYYPATITGTF